VEIIAVIVIVGILAGAILVVLRGGLSYSTYAKGWFDAQTKLTRVMQSIAYGSVTQPGVAGARDVEILASGKGIRILYGVAGQVEYTWDEVNKTLLKSGQTSQLLDHVTRFAVESQEGGKVIKVTIELTLPPPRTRVLTSKQQVLLRNKAVTEP
jgi:hypothetical protein